MKIDKNSYGSIALVYICSAVVLFLSWFFCRSLWVNIPVTVAALLFCLWQTLFFRVPVRRAVGNGNVITSVADGEVVIVQKAYEKEFLKTECIMVSVYMNFFDVHSNFWPVDGEVNYYKYHPGKHMLAFKPKASEENEHSCCCIRTADGKDVFFKQLAGTFARRIDNYAVPGLKTRAGAQCGIIKFGSRIDMYLPLDATLRVKVGDYTRACETVLAEI